MNTSDIIIKLHDLARATDDPKVAKQIRTTADQISLVYSISREAENYHSDKGYELSTHEKQAEFAKKRENK